jgi:topoisomerase-4 subunit A
MRLLDIRIMRISKFDSNKAQDKIEALEGDIEQVKHNLEHLIDFAIAYFTKLKRSTEKDANAKRSYEFFDDIEDVVLRNTKLYVNKEEGFVGTSLKKTNTLRIVLILMM